MKTMVLVMLCMCFAGCASTSPNRLVASGYCDVYDCAKMQRISQDARRNGNAVFWVTPPLKGKISQS